MPAVTIHLSDEQGSFIAKAVKSGNYPDADGVISAGLRVLEQEQEDYDWKMFTLRRAIEEGDASGVAEGDVFAEVLEHIQQRAAGRSQAAEALPGVKS